MSGECEACGNAHDGCYCSPAASSPPAPPRSEGETVVLHRDVEPDSIYPKWDTCIFPASDRESECHGFGGTPYEHAEFVPATALEQSARDAAKKERELLSRIECNGCAEGLPFTEDGKDHVVGQRGAEIRCASWRYRDENFRELYSAIRALPPEEGKNDAK